MVILNCSIALASPRRHTSWCICEDISREIRSILDISSTCPWAEVADQIKTEEKKASLAAVFIFLFPGPLNHEPSAAKCDCQHTMPFLLCHPKL